MPRLVRNILSIAIALVVIAAGGLQSAQAVLQSSVLSDNANQGMSPDDPTSPATHGQHDHGEVLPINPADCLLVCLEALPDHYLTGQEFRVASCADTTTFPYPNPADPIWLTSNQLQSLHLAARDPPQEAWRPRLSSTQPIFLRTHRLRI